jgi:DNA polymerase-3 subunit epsilon
LANSTRPAAISRASDRQTSASRRRSACVSGVCGIDWFPAERAHEAAHRAANQNALRRCLAHALPSGALGINVTNGLIGEELASAFLHGFLSGFLEDVLDDSAAKITCTRALAKKKLPNISASLDNLCDHYGIDRTARETHSAILDCQLLAKVYRHHTGAN